MCTFMLLCLLMGLFQNARRLGPGSVQCMSYHASGVPVGCTGDPMVVSAALLATVAFVIVLSSAVLEPTPPRLSIVCSLGRCHLTAQAALRMCSAMKLTTCAA